MASGAGTYNSTDFPMAARSPPDGAAKPSPPLGGPVAVSGRRLVKLSSSSRVLASLCYALSSAMLSPSLASQLPALRKEEASVCLVECGLGRKSMAESVR